MGLTKQNGFGKNLVNSLPNQCTVICAALTIGSHKKWIRKAKIPPKNLLSLTFAEWYSEKRFLNENGKEMNLVLFHCEKESINHLFFDCPLAKFICSLLHTLLVKL
jgi:hypothetical protein